MIINIVHISRLIYLTKNDVLWQNFSVNAINHFRNNVYNFNHIAEMNIITIANKLDMSYDFYIRHNMHAIEWKVIAMINKNERLVNKLNRNLRHPLYIKFEHVPISDEQNKLVIKQ